MKIRFYATSSGRAPVERYFDELAGRDTRMWAAISAALRDLQAHGMSGVIVEKRKLRDGLWELKVRSQRVLFTLMGESTVVVLHAFAKQSRRTPRAEIDVALRRMALIADQ